MNDKWTKKDKERWNDPAHIRIARRFRHHVRTPSNPKGRIHREVCFNVETCCIYGPGEAHHVDYDKPFLVLWVCVSCHRRVDHGSLSFKPRDLWDYSSVVRQKKGLQVEYRGDAYEAPEAPTGKVVLVEADDCPF